MEWVAIDVSIAGDPGVHRMADALRVRVPEIVGLLGLTFAGMAQHAQDGQLAGVTDTLLEQWAHWHGKRGLFATQFRAELCDETGLVRAWEKFNGSHIRRAKAASARTKAWREKQERERAEREQQSVPVQPQSANSNANGTHNRTHTVGATVRGTGQDQTGQDRTTKSEDPSPRAAGRKGRPTWITPFADAWKTRFGGEMPVGPAVTALAPLRAEHGEAETLRRWMNYMAVATAEHVNPARFASTWARWDTAAAPAARSIAPNAAAVEAGNIVAQIRDLIFEQPIPGQGSKPLLRNADVERLGDDIHRAYRTVGGAARFLAIAHKPDDLPHLIRAFTDALTVARAELAAAPAQTGHRHSLTPEAQSA